MMENDKRILNEDELKAVNGGYEDDGYSENPFSIGDRVRVIDTPSYGIGEVTRITSPTGIIAHFPDVRINLAACNKEFEKV